ncbi:glycoside hydrolase family 3 C-terminal domain-containing protein [Paenibacillus flagellatus]|uniref:Glycosyl hydrolase n=1 Tax=Paenibacillus flagellatus TaxID=2211139 RepID=A0A2V5KYP4_9BACL|nr:glycoside hydrolase family 3 C-terminal domain-containing protein [Paenibacillus flagellatus]PYI55126.1 glycosyl hydrolase [Paenibacillus flagellatus]
MDHRDAGPSAATPLYLQPDAPLDARVDDLVSRLTLEEKLSQLVHDSAEIERLGIPKYNWWNESLHGVARAGTATVFPQAIGLAATFSPERLHEVASAIADEGRAKHHEFVRQGDRGTYKGLTFWAPNVNLFRDPRWGRGHETYGEDPYLTSRLGVAYVRGLQGDDPRYLKAAATPKHFAVHSGPEADRHSFDSIVGPKDLRETYLPAFRACVVEGKAVSVMGAYNRVNGEPCCGSKTLLTDILRGEWGFDGYVVSDCGAIEDFHEHHRVTATAFESAAMALNNGCELNCGSMFRHLPEAMKAGLVSEETVTEAVRRLFKVRFRLGQFDPDERVPYASIPYEVVDSEEHRALNVQAARESIVLLKNENGLLPLSPGLRSIAVIGPNADDRDVLMGNYHGTASKPVTLVEGVRAAVSPATRVYYAKGCDLINKQGNDQITRGDRFLFSEAISAAERADAVVLCLGLSPRIEGEQGDAFNSEAAGDKVRLDLPSVQQKLMEELHALGKPIVLVLLNGSAVSVNWADEHIPAIVEAWYPGGEGGTAVADVLFGRHNPAGRLPVTFVRSLDDLPPFDDYAMKGRTYRYLEREPLYPFGYGLSYTSFAYSGLTLSAEAVEAGEPIEVGVTVTNAGGLAGDEVVQLYVERPDATVPVPRAELRGVSRIGLAPGESRTVTFALDAEALSIVGADGERRLEPGTFRVHVGGRQPDERSRALTGTETLAASFRVAGGPIRLAP